MNDLTLVSGVVVVVVLWVNMNYFLENGPTPLPTLGKSGFLSVFKLRENTGARRPNKFLVITTQRSGSGYVVSLLNNHSQITCGGEKLDHIRGVRSLPKERYREKFEHAWNELQHEVESTLSPNQTPNFVGFKIMYGQGITSHGKDFIRDIDRMGVRIIHLIRRNNLLRYISTEANRWDKTFKGDMHTAHPKTEEEASAHLIMKANGDPHKVLKFLRHSEEDLTRVSDMLSSTLEERNVLEIDYENVSRNPNWEMARAFSFLGAAVQNVSSNLIKIHNGTRTRDYFDIQQQEGLRKALEESEFSKFLKGW